jgi:hypothetical protein
MNKLDVSLSTLTVSPASQPDPSTRSGQRPGHGRRLIVLFPSSETDSPSLSQRIWEIARSLHLNVLLLSLSEDFDAEPQLRRKLITMASIIKDPNVSADIMIEHGNDWVGQVSKVWQEGDILACYADQKVGLMRKPLDQVLRSSLNAPIYFLSDDQPVQNPASTFISQVIPWVGSLAEVKIAQLPQDWTHTVLIYACIFTEAILIFLWNSLFA